MTTLAQNSLRQIPPFKKRKYIPQEIKLNDKNTVQQLYQELIDKKIASAADLEDFVWHRNELEAALGQEGAILYIEMTCQTDDPLRAKAYQDFIQDIIPLVKPLEDQLNHKFLTDFKRFPLDQNLFGLYVKRIKTDIELFVEKNVSLQTQVDLISQEYQALCGALTVQFRGKEYTLPQMSKFLLEPDRVLREEAWRVMAKRRLQDKDKFEDFFNRMLKLRHMVAQNAGCANYEEYQFKAYHRFDYTVKDCEAYHKVIEETVLPVHRKMLEKRAQEMGLKTLRPWDTAVDPSGLPALKPFQEVPELIQKCEKIFSRVNQDFGDQFAGLSKNGLLDLANRKGKAPGGYQQSLSESRKPFIFMNAVGVDDDVRTLLHEGGHAFHSLACSGQPILDYQHGPMEFNEVTSMGMELLGGEFIEEFYSKEDARRSQKEHFEGIVSTLIWVATVDCFQQWIYEHPEHSSEERRQAWTKIRKRFGSDLLDWQGLEEEAAYLWHRQLHIFEVPFYYIEYGFAQLGALQLWSNAKKDWDSAMVDFRKAMSLGGAKSLPEIYQASGIRFQFTKEVVGPLMERVSKEWQAL